MRSRIRSGTLVAAIGLVISVSAPTATPAVKWAAVNLTEPTIIAGAFVSGQVVFVHDDDRMARGEPCTSVHRHDPVTGPGETLVSFHCTPRWGTAPDRFTKSLARRPDGPPVMTEYQFAGDEEAHRVPLR